MLELLEPHNNLDPELDKAITQKIEYLLKKNVKKCPKKFLTIYQ